MNRSHLISLSSRLDTVLEFRQSDDENGALRTVAGGAALGVGAYGGAKLLQHRYPNQAAQVVDAAKRTGAYGSSVVSAAKEALASTKPSAGLGWAKAGASKSSAISGLLGKIKNIKFAAPVTNVIQLDAKLDDVLEFKRGMVVKDGRYYYDGVDRTDEMEAAAERGKELGASKTAKVVGTAALASAAYVGGKKAGNALADTKAGQTAIRRGSKVVSAAKAGIRSGDLKTAANVIKRVVRKG